MFIVIVALIVITIAVMVLFGMKMEQVEKEFVEATAQQKAAKLDILQARLNKKGIKVDAELGATPDVTYAVAAMILTIVCATFGLTFSTVFFMACYAACLADMIEDVLAISHVQRLMKQVSIDPVADAAQTA